MSVIPAYLQWDRKPSQRVSGSQGPASLICTTTNNKKTTTNKVEIEDRHLHVSLDLHMSVCHVQTSTFTHEYSYAIHTLDTLINTHTCNRKFCFSLPFLQSSGFWLTWFPLLKSLMTWVPLFVSKHQRVGGKPWFVSL